MRIDELNGDRSHLALLAQDAGSQFKQHVRYGRNGLGRLFNAHLHVQNRHFASPFSSLYNYLGKNQSRLDRASFTLATVVAKRSSPSSAFKRFVTAALAAFNWSLIRNASPVG